MRAVEACLAAALAAAAAAPAAASGAYRAMAKELSRDAAPQGVERVAVLPFQPLDASGPADGVNISERLTTELVRAGRVRAVERGMLGRLMEEHHLGRTGLLDPASLRRLGKILSVDAVVTGTFSAGGGGLSVNARLIDIESGVILSACERRVARDWSGAGPGLGPPASFLAGLSAASLAPARPAAEPGMRTPIKVMGSLLALDEEESLRDAPAEARCAVAAPRADVLEASIFELKARHWALLLRRGMTLGQLERNLGTNMTGAGLRRRFYDRIMDHAGGGQMAPLSPRETERLIAADEEAFRLLDRCGLSTREKDAFGDLEDAGLYGPAAGGALLAAPGGS